MKISTNAAKGEAVFKYRRMNKLIELSVSLAGIDNITINQLALHGLHAILDSNVEPKASYERILNGNLTKPPVTPLIIQAIAGVYKKSESDAEAFWGGLTPEHKRMLRTDSRIKMALITLDKDAVKVNIDSFP